MAEVTETKPANLHHLPCLLLASQEFSALIDAILAHEASEEQVLSQGFNEDIDVAP